MGKFLAYAVALAMALGWIRSPSFGAGNWTSLAPQLAIPVHISAANATISGSVDLIVQHDGQCNLQVSVAQAGDEVLHTADGTQTLSTAYRLVGNALGAGSGDTTWVASNVFRNRGYTVYGTGPADQLTLYAQVTAPPNQAPDSGDYSATIILTLSW